MVNCSFKTRPVPKSNTEAIWQPLGIMFTTDLTLINLAVIKVLSIQIAICCEIDRTFDKEIDNPQT